MYDHFFCEICKYTKSWHSAVLKAEHKCQTIHIDQSIWLYKMLWKTLKTLDTAVYIQGQFTRSQGKNLTRGWKSRPITVNDYDVTLSQYAESLTC